MRVVCPACGPKLERLEVIDRVRVDRATELRTERAHRKLVLGARWLLLKKRESLHPREDVTLETG